MAFRGETLAAAFKAEAEGATALAAAYSAPHVAPTPAATTIRDVVTRYKAAPEFLKLRDSTRLQWSRWLDEIIQEFGDLPTRALKAKGIRDEFLKWRDRRADKPRTADYGIQVLKRVLSFGLDRELVEANPAEGIGALYRANRADKIVEEAELTAILSHVTPEAALAIRLAAETGMRRGDLVNLKWDHVTDTMIQFATGKSNSTRHVAIPLTTEARAIVAELRAKRDKLRASGAVPSAFLLTSDRGLPWAKDSLTQAFIRARDKAGINDKHLHDLRGTAVTRFAARKLTNEQVADIVGWELSRVASIRKRYVDATRIAEAVVSLLESDAKAG
nr:site-specific integrase [Caulobacter sp. 17J80-11]